ncbi:MAG: hypothetical protein RJA49_1213 [Actinomycetota bacterium]
MTSGIALVLAAFEHHHLLTTEMVDDLGVPRARWHAMQANGEWIQVTPTHFRHAATPLTFEMQVRAGAEWLGHRGALFGTTALHWLSVDIPEPRKAEFIVPRARRSVANWMVIHTSKLWDPKDAITHNGVRTTKAARAIVDLASIGACAKDLERAIDATVRCRRAAVSNVLDELALVDREGRHGRRVLRELLLDSGGESALERRFLRIVRQAGLPRPVCQVPFRDAAGRAIRVDFLFGTVVVEVSGRLGHVSDSDRRRDAQRRNALQQQGFTVLEFTTAEVIEEPDTVIDTLRRSL